MTIKFQDVTLIRHKKRYVPKNNNNNNCCYINYPLRPSKINKSRGKRAAAPHLPQLLALGKPTGALAGRRHPPGTNGRGPAVGQSQLAV